MQLINIKHFSLIGLTAILAGCSQTASNPSTEKVLWDFEQTAHFKHLQAENALIEPIVQGTNHAAKISFDSKQQHVSGFEFKSESGWDWTHHQSFAFALDIQNPKNTSVHMYVTAKDKAGKTHNRSFVVPKNSSNTYFIELKGIDLDVETGIRSNPPSWETSYVPIVWRWGTKNIDISQITSIKFNVRGVLEDKELIIDNARLIYPKAVNKQYLTHLVDKFGQSTTIDFVNKVSTTQELVDIHKQEQAELTDKNFADRSKFNGWKNGPKLEATGYYRTEKYQGKWTLVDPEGYLFFSNGIANVRLANTSTITGYDFDHSKIAERKAGDLTPEDSLGLNPAPQEAWPSRQVASEVRANMFSWLPEYGSELADNFGYRRSVHTGAIERGETFSFYRANLQRKYQTNDDAELMQKWRETTVKRMQSWGFTSFGNWIDPNYYDMQQYPYFANGWIIGDYKTVSSGNDYWSPLPDPFDPVFKQRTDITVKQIADEVKNSPWCVGVFIDNEKSWGMMGSVQNQYGIVLNTLTRPASESPTKQVFVNELTKKYGSIEQLNHAWQTQISSWDELANGIKLDEYPDSMLADLSQLLFVYAEQYFKIVKQSVKHYMPNHMYMGARFADWGMTPEIRKAAAKHADVVSYNYYKEGINDDFWRFLAEIDKPSIIGEFHNGALDSGLLNPGLIHAESQADRGHKYQEYLNSVIDNPYLVGAHWFQYIDSPLTGRAYDGENYNVGFVSVTDIPYQPLVDAVKQVNKNIYPRRFSQTIYQINDQAALNYLDINQGYEEVASGFEWVEGPLWIEESNPEKPGYLVFSDIPNNKVMKFSATDGLSTYLPTSGFSNGLALSAQDQLIIMQSRSRQVVQMDASLSAAKDNFKVLASHYQGKRLNSPNDVAVHQNGSVFFTDPPYGLPKQMDDPAKELDFQGVYQLTAEGELKLVDKTLTFPNGIALSPDNQTLYVAVSDPQDPVWYQYKLNEQGDVLSKNLFYQVQGDGTHDNGAPDGLKVHSSGVIFATGPHGIWLFSPSGQVLAHINIPYFCANLAFDKNEEYLYITAHKRLLRIKLK